MFLTRKMHGNTYKTLPFPGDADFTNPSQSGKRQWGWGFSTVPGGNFQNGHRFCPRCVAVAYIDIYVYIIYGRMSDPGMGPDLPRLALTPRTLSLSAFGQEDWIFHALRGDMDQGDHSFRSRCVEVSDAGKIL